MKKFLITGGTGFIGSRLLHSLEDSENEIILVTNFESVILIDSTTLSLKVVTTMHTTLN